MPGEIKIEIKELSIANCPPLDLNLDLDLDSGRDEIKIETKIEFEIQKSMRIVKVRRDV